MSNEPKAFLLEGQGVVDMLVLIWLDGFTSGASTALLTALEGIPEEAADELANRISDRIQQDPLAMLEVEREVKERLTGDAVDGSGRTITAVKP
ncbi:hypothetical protein GCM10022234_00680 [Aeromicrobium panaciterrae]|uniref:hypothetical protein n=1 Tax=Aeromicrobium panaciterrae TaxID=363861 RepID=UPI0031D13DB4